MSCPRSSDENLHIFLGGIQFLLHIQMTSLEDLQHLVNPAHLFLKQAVQNSLKHTSQTRVDLASMQEKQIDLLFTRRS